MLDANDDVKRYSRKWSKIDHLAAIFEVLKMLTVIYNKVIVTFAQCILRRTLFKDQNFVNCLENEIVLLKDNMKTVYPFLQAYIDKNKTNNIFLNENQEWSKTVIFWYKNNKLYKWTLHS